jgi:hypothetical protein
MRIVLIIKQGHGSVMLEPFGLATGALRGARDNPVSAATSRADGRPVPPPPPRIVRWQSLSAL